MEIEQNQGQKQAQNDPQTREKIAEGLLGRRDPDLRSAFPAAVQADPTPFHPSVFLSPQKVPKGRAVDMLGMHGNLLKLSS